MVVATGWRPPAWGAEEARVAVVQNEAEAGPYLELERIVEVVLVSFEHYDVL